jgi:dolichyl-phosphate beta-glucosyltransferase
LNRTATPPVDGGPVELSIVIPAYNEAATIEQTLRTVARYLDGQAYESELIVVDDGSTDATSLILAGCAKDRPSMRVLPNEPNRGKGGSVKRGVLAARGKYIFFMDADLSVPIEELTGALVALSQSDCPVLIGSRKVSGARIERRQPIIREYLGHGFTWLARALLSPSIVDFTCGFKGFRRDDAKALFQLQQCNDWAFDAEILYLARLMGKPVHQYPVCLLIHISEPTRH